MTKSSKVLYGDCTEKGYEGCAPVNELLRNPDPVQIRIAQQLIAMLHLFQMKLQQ